MNTDRLAEIEARCPACDGSGEVRTGPRDWIDWKLCPDCPIEAQLDMFEHELHCWDEEANPGRFQQAARLLTLARTLLERDRRQQAVIEAAQAVTEFDRPLMLSNLWDAIETLQKALTDLEVRDGPEPEMPA